MIRVFGHYVSPALLGLLGAEILSSFGAFVLGPIWWKGWSEGNVDPAWIAILPKALVSTLVLVAILIALGLYERRFWRGRADMLLRVGVGFLFGSFALAVLGWWVPALAADRGEASLAFGLAGAVVLVLRFGFLQATGRAAFARRVLVVGVGAQAARLERLRPDETWGCQILGYVQAHEDEPDRVSPERRLQVTHRVIDLAVKLQIDEIVVALDDQRRGFPLDELLECKLAGIRICPVLTFAERETGQITLDALRPSNVLFAEGFPALFDRQALKRGLDVIVSFLLLALTWPVMLLAALAIGLECRFQEPILYRQVRVGQHDRPFTILKFRTMRANAGSEFAKPGDPRITRVGRLLRETRIDELPQLVNVLRGEMSLVGPRPEQPQYVAQLRAAIPFYGLRHLGRPGLTGWAQICYPYADSEESSREKLQYDLYYLKNASLGFDLLILLQTVHAILWGSGAR
ncbi:MAG: TIGR03013 family XrtA/PEP-CTERM system glycosyltransferase [Candidatus Competibacter sp.]